jgi:hypothetical protein
LLDSGFFAQGSYLTFDADYAWHVYGEQIATTLEEKVREMKSKGQLLREDEEMMRHALAPVLLVCRVVTGRVYPADRRLEAAARTTTVSDMIGRANMPGYDAHFALVKHGVGAVFNPVSTMHDARDGDLFTELVVFDMGQVLPIAIIEPSIAPSRGTLKS